MPAYSYVIQTPAGKSVRGTLNSDNMATASDKLKADGSTIISIEDALLGGIGAGRKDEGGGTGPAPNPKELAVFCRQFVSITEAGVPVVSCLDMLVDQTLNKKLRFGLQECKRLILAGETFSEAMQQMPKIFPKMLATLTEAGEKSGSIETSFTRMAVQFEKEAHLKSMIKKATVYPTVVMVVAMVVVVVMLVFVVPQFEAMFADMGTELPAITIFVVNCSAYLQERWYVVLTVMIGSFLGIIKFFKTPLGESISSVMTLKIPVVNNLVAKSACARLARTLSTLMGAGMPQLEAIRTTANTMTNLVYKKAVGDIALGVENGEQISVLMKEANMFPPLLFNMVSIGEQTGKVDVMLDTLAGYFEEEVEAATEAMMALLEPLTIILLAVVVGGIIGSVMAPMAKMYDELANL